MDKIIVVGRDDISKYHMGLVEYVKTVGDIDAILPLYGILDAERMVIKTICCGGQKKEIALNNGDVLRVI